MKKILFSFCCASAMIACNNADKTTEVKKDSAIATTVIDTTKKAAPSVPDSSLTIDAKFVSFSLGDAPHFMFADHANKEIEFGLNEDTLTKFAMELPEGKANSDNQGWESNKALQGRWFNIKYVTRKMVLYEGGPLEDTKVIIDAKPALK